MSAEQSSAAMAAKRVQGIIEAAEKTAREIEEGARAEAAAYVAGAKDAIDGLVAQAATLQERLDEIATALGEAKAAVDAMASEAAALGPARAAAPEEPVAPEVGPVVPETPEPDPEIVAEAKAQVREAGGDQGRVSEGARLIALNMALSGTPRDETARYLRENFALDDQEDLLDDVYARAGS